MRTHAGICKTVEKCKSEQMRGRRIVILVFLATDVSKSSQRIGMLDTRHEKPWEQGAGRRAMMMITQPQMIPGYHTGFLLGNTKAFSNRLEIREKVK